MKPALGLLVLSCLVPACGGGGSDATADAAPIAYDAPAGCSVALAPGGTGDDVEAVQTALIEAASGSTVCFTPGTYVFDTELSLTVDDVTVRGTGASKDDVVLDFAGQTTGSNGLFVQDADGFTLENLWIRDPAGDGVRVSNADRVVFRKVKVTWTADGDPMNGAYAIYPVTCTNVLVEECEIIGASDAGIYVGQSSNVIVRTNYVHGNVAGIEIENTTGAEVTGNHAFDNTGGILVFNLPNLPIGDGRRTLIAGNMVENNNRENFAPSGNIVAYVPAGTGIMVFSTDEIEVRDNDIHDNRSAGLLVASLLSLGMPIEDPAYDPFPETIWAHDNTFANNGGQPDGILILAGQATLEDMIWDGVYDPTKDNTDGHLSVCLSGNGAATFRNIDAANEFMDQTTDLAPHTCEHPPLPAITLVGVGP